MYYLDTFHYRISIYSCKVCVVLSKSKQDVEEQDTKNPPQQCEI